MELNLGRLLALQGHVSVGPTLNQADVCHSSKLVLQYVRAYDVCTYTKLSLCLARSCAFKFGTRHPWPPAREIMTGPLASHATSWN